jgi:hypothetical protein
LSLKLISREIQKPLFSKSREKRRLPKQNTRANDQITQCLCVLPYLLPQQNRVADRLGRAAHCSSS